MAFTSPAYLALSRHGIFYFRMTIPATLRRQLGRCEVKRSLKSRHRRTAIQRARACASHFEALFATLQEQPVTYLEMKQLLEDAQASMWTSLRHGPEANGPLTRADRSEVVGEIKVLRTLAANNDYTPKAQAMADAVLANANINLPRTSDTYQQFCVETTKMLDGLWQAYLAHSEAMDGYTGPLKPCPAPAHQTPSNTAQFRRRSAP
jgi:hypothetical protein